jgi:4-amino-4-deoxy-L-arabinose transferase-like glycosyltransferase
MRRTKALVFVLILGLVLRLLLLLAASFIPALQRLVAGGDAVGYTQLAHSLYQARSFRFAAGGPTAYRMPGYPLFLAAAYVPWKLPLPAQLAQILADVLTAWITYLMARHLARGAAAPLLAAAAVALNPLMMVTSISLLPETLSILSTTLALFLLLKRPDSRRAWMIAALVLGFGIYLKPTMAPAALALLLLLATRRWIASRAWAAGVAVLAPFVIIAACVAPWLVRNCLVMDACVPLTTSNGSNLYGGNNSQADGGYVSDEPYVLPDMSEAESNRVFTRRAMAWIGANPADFLRLLPAKAARFFWPLSFGTSGYIPVPSPVFAGVLMGTIAFCALVAYGTWRLAVAGRWWELAVLAVTPAVLLLLSLLTFGAARFALPGFPGCAVLACCAVEAVAARFYQAGHGRPLPAGP